ncbi:arylesterase [Pedobacter sp. Leaf194]|uniref:arylesterase n=1 Tax=Pedobacter sp. Leaf194 TaxID=1736297 RepID=UPI0007032559|nr:arylesterase [Pedobacter sp. Leaf194]KQS36322.1 GDSL family lipase [Pedobacter sp. Leaf194]RYD75854.1 MAG: arylesterase [Sphingobacteriales bacterium]
MLRKRVMALIVLTGILQACSNTDNKAESAGKHSAQNVVKETAKATKNILFFGTSLTAGLGLDPTEAYPALIQNKIDSLRLPYKVINAGLSGETSAGGKSRIDWLLKQRVDVFVLELGSNDGLRGVPTDETTKNLQAIIDKVKAKYPDAKLVMAGMQMPPSMGKKYTSDFKNIFPDLARKNNMSLIPFLLEKVGGIPKLNQPDGIHPTAEGDKILAKNVWAVLKPLL